MGEYKSQEDNAKDIKTILGKDTYVIPRYQRNYAWGRPEITQLIRDIVEYFAQDEKNDGRSYYLGTLVCFKREDGNFELIDGQQRHTTLTLINLVLKIKGWDYKDSNYKFPNLKFDSRKKAQDFIEKLYDIEIADFDKELEGIVDDSTVNFKNAIEIIQDELREMEKEDKSPIQTFAENFYNKLKLFRVEVPPKTDLNNYFVIMNNRGEQLEKHEILKAKLMDKFKESKIDGIVYTKRQKKEIFADIWDACANMGSYVYLDKNLKDELFFNGELKPSSFDEVVQLLSKDSSKEITKEQESQNSDTQDNLSSIIGDIQKGNIKPKGNTKDDDIKSPYKSIIDFPNFLLQVLKVMGGNNNVTLDDKNLLKNFDSIKPNPEEFIFNLLKYRTLFDKYVIKQDLSNANAEERNWGLRKLNHVGDGLIKTFDKEEQDDKELVMLQTMLYYSNSANTYNTWLNKVLEVGEFSNLNHFTEKLSKIATDKFDASNLSYPAITVYNLYYIDFLLWKFYYENIRSKKQEERIEFKGCLNESENQIIRDLKSKIERQKSLFHSFKFKQINSKEHLLSQEHARINIDEEIYHGIGNLCLISASQNSKGNKAGPNHKRDLYIDDNTSLKRLVMFESYNVDSSLEEHQENNHKSWKRLGDKNWKWGEDEILAHANEITKFLKFYGIEI